jgi:Phosphotransferase enzyme family
MWFDRLTMKSPSRDEIPFSGRTDLISVSLNNFGGMFMAASEKLPRSIEELTPQWLNGAIRSHCPDITVTSATIEKIIWGTATKVLMDVQYAGDYQKYGIPHKLCVKGELDERVRQAIAGITMTGTQVEADFYNDLAPKLGLPLPRHWYGGSEPGMGILILDNLTAVNGTFGAPTEPWTPDLVSKAFDILAKLHASTWDKKYPELTWLQVGAANVRQYNEFLMSDGHWKEHFVRPEVFQLPAALADRERGLNALRNLWRYDDTNAHCVIHGDAHLGNTAIDASGQPYFIDWAGPCYSCWAFDVSNFMVGALTVADRRANERDLISHYLDRLAFHGGPALNRAEAWDDFRRHILNGLVWTTLPTALQSTENVHAMGERYSAALIDHDTFKLMGV